MSRDKGPPDKEGSRATPDPAATTINHTASHHKADFRDCSAGRQCEHPARQLRRRRMASYRCEQLPGGYRDPFRAWRPETLSEKQAEGAAAAARHLLDAGVVPRFNIFTLRALWRSGDRALAQELYELCGGDA